jgi:hypothetical protein
MQRPAPVFETCSRRQWKKFRPEDFKAELQASKLCDPSCFHQMNVEELTDCYNNVITAILDRTAPFATVSSQRRRTNPWFDKECRKTKRQARHLEGRFRRTGIATVRTAWTVQLRSLRRMCGRKRRA